MAVPPSRTSVYLAVLIAALAIVAVGTAIWLSNRQQRGNELARVRRKGDDTNAVGPTTSSDGASGAH
jgi:hypothetical protein